MIIKFDKLLASERFRFAVFKEPATEKVSTAELVGTQAKTV